MNVNFSKTVISATQFVDCCKKLDIQGNLSDSDLKAIYSCADKYGYDIVLAENYQDRVEHLSIYELFSKYLDWGCLKDIGMEMGVSQDSVDATLNDDDDREKDEIINIVIRSPCFQKFLLSFNSQEEDFSIEEAIEICKVDIDDFVKRHSENFPLDLDYTQVSFGIHSER